MGQRQRRISPRGSIKVYISFLSIINCCLLRDVLIYNTLSAPNYYILFFYALDFGYCLAGEFFSSSVLQYRGWPLGFAAKLGVAAIFSPQYMVDLALRKKLNYSEVIIYLYPHTKSEGNPISVRLKDFTKGWSINTPRHCHVAPDDEIRPTHGEMCCSIHLTSLMEPL